MDKVCKITKGVFTWILEVDNHSIGFEGIWNAKYFAKHYLELGYSLETINWKYDEKMVISL